MLTEEPFVSYNSRNTSIEALRQKVASRVWASNNADRLYQCLETLSEEPMPCFLSEEELDKEVGLSMKSGNATPEEVNQVFGRWMR